MSTIITQDLGLERVGRMLALVLHDEFNDNLSEISAEREGEDEEFYALMGLNMPVVAPQLIEEGNFLWGHHPSLLDAHISRLPNCSAWCIVGNPDGDEEAGWDQGGEKYVLTAIVEIMAISKLGELDVNGRLNRMVDAAHRTISANLTLRGISDGKPLRPTVTLGSVFDRGGGTGDLDESQDTYWWQGASMEYTIDRFTTS